MFFRLVCYTAVFSVAALRDDTKNGCVADEVPPPECTSLYFVIKPFVHNYVLSSFVSIATRLYFDFPYKLVHLVVFVF